MTRDFVHMMIFSLFLPPTAETPVFVCYKLISSFFFFFYCLIFPPMSSLILCTMLTLLCLSRNNFVKHLLGSSQEKTKTRTLFDYKKASQVDTYMYMVLPKTKYCTLIPHRAMLQIIKPYW